MTSLAHQQCFNHPGREAIVRCPACKRDFCRECVTEHEDRYLCSTCLLRESAKAAQSKRKIGVPVGAILAMVGLLTAWTVYYAATEYLVLRSGSTHNYRSWHAR